MEGNPQESGLAEDLSGKVFGLISELLAERGGGMVEGFVMIASYVNHEGEPCFAWSISPDQRMITTAGLIQTLRIGHEAEMVQFITGDHSGS